MSDATLPVHFVRYLNSDLNIKLFQNQISKNDICKQQIERLHIVDDKTREVNDAEAMMCEGCRMHDFDNEIDNIRSKFNGAEKIQMYSSAKNEINKLKKFHGV